MYKDKCIIRARDIYEAFDLSDFESVLGIIVLDPFEMYTPLANMVEVGEEQNNFQLDIINFEEFGIGHPFQLLIKNTFHN